MTDSPAKRLVRHLKAEGIRDLRVLTAMEAVPRDRFVPLDQRDLAWENTALPIGYRQTISQPSVVAMMTEALDVQPGHKVLEIGTGSGYQAAVLAHLGAEVFTIEYVPELAERARDALAALGVRRVHVRAGDGNLGWPEEAPFDRIIATAVAPRLPPRLMEQLKPDGVLVMPLDQPAFGENLVRVTLGADGEPHIHRFCPVRFVPFVGSAEAPP
ncbi:MAG: protein-L-isoaspartate(D-aspartate) O-methyltransferase [Alphaproteobacteria bacterium]|nr:protein-L-isoaspartate(D-aspartate) O-methyltransferase [Alphaproteobacteria bacterium]MCB9929785.1 protein-L-isoaspartate(D-aspartate) O-methyltransferase [Alphaproteobacteria bacterium]